MKINRELMIDNIQEAIGQLESLKHALQTFRSPINQDGVRDDVVSSYQCLNFAWNTRHLSQDKFWSLCEDECRFQEMRRLLPTDIDIAMPIGDDDDA